MTTSEQPRPTSEGYMDFGTHGASWEVGLAELEGSGTYWMATLHPSGRPHVVPVLAVVHGGHLHVAAGPRTRKARNLARDPAVSITTHAESLDVVLEGRASRVADPVVVASVADACATKYGWETSVRDAALHAEGAPTAGPPPYHVYVAVPDRAFGFPTGDDAPPTRWTFPAST